MAHFRVQSDQYSDVILGIWARSERFALELDTRCQVCSCIDIAGEDCGNNHN